jgi:diguanylate cyclase (GGDEF)-like protein
MIRRVKKFRKVSRFQIIVASLLLFALLEGVMSLLIWKNYEEKKRFILDRNAKIFYDVYASTRLAYTKVSKLLYEEVINRPEIIEIFKDASDADPEVQTLARKRLYDALEPTYERMRFLNLKQLHFHLSDGTSFLRFHKPEKFGDNLTGVRYSVEAANRDKRYVEGFEEGRIYNGFRHVYPLFDANGNLLGSVEASLSFAALHNDIEAVIGNHVDFLVKRSLVEQKVWKEEQDHYYPSLISRDYLHEQGLESETRRPMNHDALSLDISEEASARMAEHRRFALFRDGFIVSFIPVSNVQGEKGAAYLISYNKSNALTPIKHDAIVMWLFGLATALLSASLAYLLMQKMAQISELATYDTLTGVFNRNSLGRRIEEEIARCDRSGEPFSLIYLDIDNFKALNDRFGHDGGDKVLKGFATLLGDNIRRTDAVGRWGGEEFLICLPQTDCEAAMTVAEKLRHAVISHGFGVPMEVTGSFGVTAYQEGETADMLVSRADRHLYRAKAGGRNRVAGSDAAT